MSTLGTTTVSQNEGVTSPTLIIGPAETRSSASLEAVLTSSSLGIIIGDPNQSPLASRDAFATQAADGSLPYELGGTSVFVGGRAAMLLITSASHIAFVVPAGLIAGEAEVIVTSEDGYVSRGTVSISALAPGIFTASSTGTGEAIAINAVTYTSGVFSTNTIESLSDDKRTRLILFATGLSSGAANTDTGNDIIDGDKVTSNYAEGVVVEARLMDGRVLNLPVEFAGAQGGLIGLDQVTVVLVPELQNAGEVELVVLIDGHRSNTATIVVR